ncbi:MAG: flagellar basal-body rod protein FlgG [Gemmatimonadales bacterium]|nr:MAG: flagellar basal-body rod protein FlgG [Gemmatimonadales bacterium]
MDPALRTAATGMIAQQTRVEVIANNLANVNTTAFQRSRAQFEDLLYQTVREAQPVMDEGTDVIPAVQVGRGTRLAAVQRVTDQGPLHVTGRSLDIAIEGDGYLQVLRPSGDPAYTRDGSLTISDRGVLVTQQGYPVLPDVTIPMDASSVDISRDGVISAVLPGSVYPVELGRIELARFSNTAGLMAMGENLFAETGASGQPLLGYPQEDGFGRVVQGALEGSNVEVVQEMVEMITALRAYETNSKAIKTAEEMGQMANNLIR